MPKEIQIRCDCGCGTMRLQSNNWIQAQIDDACFRSWKWDDKRANRKGILFLATEECCHKVYSRWLASRMHKPQETDEKIHASELIKEGLNELVHRGLGNENQDEVQGGKEVGR